MKKILLFSLLVFVLMLPTRLLCDESEKQNSRFSGAFTTGYVFKNDDCVFKKVHGHGMGNVITGDGCYYPWESWGIGMKVSYWLAIGHTTFLKRRTLLQEVPITFYVRKLFDVGHDVQMYASLGGGIAWIKEQSYLGHVHTTKGIGEAEVGLNYPVQRRLYFTTALRYLFPRQSQGCEKIDVGGVDLRAGLGFAF